MLEKPIVAGAGGGVGATAVASALGALDAGRCRAGQPVHVLVCRLTMASIGDAHRAIAAAPAAPVLAVVADIPRASLTGGMRGQIEPRDGAWVLVNLFGRRLGLQQRHAACRRRSDRPALPLWGPTRTSPIG
jgi:hypothetical protein